MTDPTKHIDYSHLSTAERILLAQELWESVHQDADETPLTEEQTKEIHRRWTAFEAGSMESTSWTDMKRTLLASP